MPRVVDHEHRRTEIARAAIGVIAEKGLVAATVRDVAEAASCSTGMVNHYFADKDALLLAAAKLAVDDLVSGFLAPAASGKSGPSVLRDQLLSTLPASSTVRPSHHVVVHLYAGALHSPAMAEHVRTLYGVAIGEIAGTLAAWPARRLGPVVGRPRPLGAGAVGGGRRPGDPDPGRSRRDGTARPGRTGRRAGAQRRGRSPRGPLDLSRRGGAPYATKPLSRAAVPSTCRHISALAPAASPLMILLISRTCWRFE